MRGGARAGAGAPIKEVKRDKTIQVKMTEKEIIVIDISAEVLEMKRSEFIRHCINKELERLAKIYID